MKHTNNADLSACKSLLAALENFKVWDRPNVAHYGEPIRKSLITPLVDHIARLENEAAD